MKGKPVQLQKIAVPLSFPLNVLMPIHPKEMVISLSSFPKLPCLPISSLQNWPWPHLPLMQIKCIDCLSLREHSLIWLQQTHSEFPAPSDSQESQSKTENVKVSNLFGLQASAGHISAQGGCLMWSQG
jgi:hypothetical protein